MPLSGATIAEGMFGKCLNLTQSLEYYTSTYHVNGNSSSLSSSNNEL